MEVGAEEDAGRKGGSIAEGGWVQGSVYIRQVRLFANGSPEMVVFVRLRLRESRTIT